MVVDVCPAAPSHLDFISQCQKAMARETEDLELDQKTLLQGVQAVLNDPLRGRYWLAITAEGPIACLLTTAEWSDWRNGWVYWIQSLYVLPAHRNQGVFRRMYKHLKNQIKQDSKLCGIRLYVDKRNHAAMQVYQSLGMSSEHYDLYEWLKN